MNHLRPADPIVGRIAVGLQKAFELSQKLLRPVASTSQTEVERHGGSRSAILPHIPLVILPSAFLHLHVQRSFIGLNGTALD
jgi:hypothetical protein